MKLPHLLTLALLSTTTVACGEFDHHGDQGFDDAGDLGEETPGEDASGDAGGDGGVVGGDGGGDSGGDDGDDDDDGDMRIDDGGDDDGGDDDGGHDDCGDDHGDDGAEFECIPHELALVAGQHYDAGWVTVTTEDDGLRIDVEATAPWQLNLVHVFASHVAPTSNPGSFPMAEALDHAQSFSAFISFDDIGAECGELVNVAVHAEVSKPMHGLECQQETAWGEGDHEFEQGWGSYLAVRICCD